MGLDVRSQEEFDLFDSADDEQDFSTVIRPPDWLGAGYRNLREALSAFRFGQVWDGIRISHRGYLSLMQDARERVPVSLRLFFVVSVSFAIVVWSSWSIKQPESSTNSRPLWAKTRLEVDSYHEAQ